MPRDVVIVSCKCFFVNFSWMYCIYRRFVYHPYDVCACGPLWDESISAVTRRTVYLSKKRTDVLNSLLVRPGFESPSGRSEIGWIFHGFEHKSGSVYVSLGNKSVRTAVVFILPAIVQINNLAMDDDAPFVSFRLTKLLRHAYVTCWRLI